MKIIGKIHSNGDLEQHYYNQGFVYKNYDNFIKKNNEICYIPELDKEMNIKDIEVKYTYNDLYLLCKGFIKKNNNYLIKHNINLKNLVNSLFEELSWQDPNTLLNDWLD